MINKDNKIIKISGYKSFAEDGTNIYGKIFEIGKYHCDGEIKFGINGNGYHFSKRLEDTIRFGLTNDNRQVGNVLIAKVVGSGIIDNGYDDYNGYYDMYSVSDLEIIKYLTREEIISYMLQITNEDRIIRFVSLFALTEEEKNLFYGKSNKIDMTIDYYQNGIKDAYTKKKKTLIKN